MSDVKLISGLQKVFWVVGWASLVITAAGMAGTVYFHMKINFDTATGTIPGWSDTFYLLPQFKILVSGVTDAFFAFLVSSVFGMIFHRRPVDIPRSERFLLITCIGFALEAAISFFGWAEYLVRTANLQCSGEQCELWFRAVAAGSYALNAISALSPLLYSITIYVLFRHFASMVTFESEVV